jgi:magnesium-transporting ATPase (P-type)
MDHPLKGLLNISQRTNSDTKILFSLGVEPVDHDVLKKPPRKVTDSMIDRKLIINMVTSAAVIVIGTLGVFYAEVLYCYTFQGNEIVDF